MSYEVELKVGRVFVFLVGLVIVAGCQYTARDLLESDESQLQIRRIQTRAFETTDREKTLRTVIATLQDLGFVVDNADYTLGSISSTKLNYYALRMTVTVRPRGTTQLSVRANARFNVTPVLEPEPYQQFFSALARAMFLEAHEVD